MRRVIGYLAIVILIASLFGAAGCAGAHTTGFPPAAPKAVGAGADWAYYGGDAASTKHSRLTEIDSTNVSQLRMVWRWTSPDREIFENEQVEPNPRPMQNTPLAIDGVLYVSTALNVISAIDGATGETIWTFDPEVWKEPSDHSVHRGVSYWRDGIGEERILFGTSSAFLYSLDAQTGLRDSTFGDSGRVDLSKGLSRPIPEDERWRYGVTSPPIVCRDVVVIGSLIIDYDDVSIDSMIPGDVRGFDVRTGELLWTFHSVPQEGEFGNDSWEKDSWKRYGGANVWAPMSADQELGYVYLPFSSPSYDFYGGERPGDNLFGDSLVCLDARTGKRIWHFQIVHQDLWNHDLNSPPILADIVVDGKPIKAVVQLTKQTFCFVFDRITGEPVWPIEERPVPASTVPGEQASPTQPFPSKPAPLDLQGLTEDDLLDFTPELRQKTLEAIAAFDLGPLYSPPSERGVIKLPGSLGGVDWTGGALHPSGRLYVPTKVTPEVISVSPAEDAKATERFIGRFPDWPSGYRGLPITKPPYGRLTAIDLNSGEHRWMVPLGPGPVDHPELRDLNLQPLGTNARQFILTTTTLLLVATAEPWGGGDYYKDPERYLRAFDLEDGRLIAEINLPANASGTPMTYMAGGRQHIAVASSSNRRSSQLVSMAIPRDGEKLIPQGYDREDADHVAYYDAVKAFDTGDIVRLRELLGQHPDLVQAHGYLDEDYEHKGFRGATLLHLVAGQPIRTRLQENALEMSQLFLDAGAAANAVTLDSISTLELVIEGRQPGWLDIRLDLAEALLAAGGEPNVSGGKLFWLATVKNEPEIGQLMYESGAVLDLRLAAGLNLVERMEGFFNSDGSLTDNAGTGFRNPLSDPDSVRAVTDQLILDEALSFAAINASVEAAAFLLDRGGDLKAQPPGFHWPEDPGWSALHKAVDHCKPDMARWLLERGADPDLKNPKWEDSARDWATSWACDEVKQVFAELPSE
jgi:quinoprotein glucose dehydrogenase